MTQVNPTTLTERIARETQSSHNPLRRRDVEQVLALFLEFVAAELSKPAGRVYLTGIGILEVHEFNFSGGLKNIITGESIRVEKALRYRVRFKASRSLKQKLRNIQVSQLDIPVD